MPDIIHTRWSLGLRRRKETGNSENTFINVAAIVILSSRKDDRYLSSVPVVQRCIISRKGLPHILL